MVPCIGEKCDELYNCDCIIYNGPDLLCYGIYHGDNLCRILEIAASNLPSCTITPPPTTTTTTCPCVGYDITARKGAAVSYSYLPCGATKEIIEYLNTDPTRIICTQRGSIPQLIAGNASILPTNPECCTPTTTIPVNTQRCTADNSYFGVEQPRPNAGNYAWTYFPMSFKLNSMKLNGTEYVTGITPILTINSPNDLHIGTGIDGNSYVMNMSDWLNTLAVGSRFTFYDNMRVIDYPYANATLYIEIEFTDSTGASGIYLYDSLNGFSYDGGYTFVGTYTCEPN